MRTTRRGAAILATLLTLVVVSACSSGKSTGASGATTAGTSSGTGSVSSSSSGPGSVSGQGNGKTVVFFSNPTSYAFVGSVISSVKQVLGSVGYKVDVIQDNATQANLDQLVQQYLATGQKPAAFIYWPWDATASVNDVRQLSQVAPVFQTNGETTTAEQPYVKAYAGTGNLAVGVSVGQAMISLRTQLLQSGHKLHSTNGNLLIVGPPTGYTRGSEMFAGFQQATKSQPFNVLANVPAQSTQQSDFSVASQIIPKYKGQGIDFIYTDNDPGALGVIQALKQDGLTPGKDVYVISADCGAGGLPLLSNGEEAASLFAAPQLEGYAVAYSLIAYFASGKQVQPGSYTQPVQTALPELSTAPPHLFTFAPVAALTKANVSSLNVYGVNAVQGCP